MSDRIKSVDWKNEHSTYVEQGYVIVEEEGTFWWVR